MRDLSMSFLAAIEKDPAISNGIEAATEVSYAANTIFLSLTDLQYHKVSFHILSLAGTSLLTCDHEIRNIYAEINRVTVSDDPSASFDLLFPISIDKKVDMGRKGSKKGKGKEVGSTSKKSFNTESSKSSSKKASRTEETIGEIFVDAEYTPLKLRQEICRLIDFMTLKSAARSKRRFDEHSSVRFLAVSSLDWGSSRTHNRDFWRLAGAALYESLILMMYRPDIFLTEMGVVRKALEAILLKHAKEAMSIDERTGIAKTNIRYEFPDGLQIPEDFDESKFNKYQVHDHEFGYLATCQKIQFDKELQNLVQFASKLECLRSPNDRQKIDFECLGALKTLIHV